jgi:NAD+ kinase
MKKIKNIKIYTNDNKKSKEVLDKLTNTLLLNNYNIVEENPDIVIAIGGDGSFLRMIKEEEYNSDYYYVGINAGTLGFLQEVKIEDIDSFIKCLNEGTYKIDEIGIQETKVVTEKEELSFYSLNEIVIREKDLNTLHLKVYIKDNLLENYVGDGILIATSIGSTAYNLSYGGSIIYDTFHTLQITPIAPLNNSAYRNLLNPVIIPDKDQIKVIPDYNSTNLLISIDGENKVFKKVKYLETKVDSKRIKMLRFGNYNYWQKINDKFLSK